MAETLSNEQLQKLENVMAIEFHGIEIQEECTQLVTSELTMAKDPETHFWPVRESRTAVLAHWTDTKNV